MIQDTRKICGRKIIALDGEIGVVHDFYFDDKAWTVRYIQVDTGTWLSERRVLLAPEAFHPLALGRYNADNTVLSVQLTRKQIEDSPSIEMHRPVSRQYEEEYYQFYGWPSYWSEDAPKRADGFPTVPECSILEDLSRHEQQVDCDSHLRSTREMTGYKICTKNGVSGTVCGFNLDANSWKLREIVVEMGHWYSGKEILILPENIERISYETSTIHVDLSQEDLKLTHRHDVAQVSAGSL